MALTAYHDMHLPTQPKDCQGLHKAVLLQPCYITQEFAHGRNITWLRSPSEVWFGDWPAVTALRSNADSKCACTDWGCSQAASASHRLLSTALGSDSMSICHLSHSTEVAGLAMAVLGESMVMLFALTYMFQTIFKLCLAIPLSVCIRGRRQQ